MRDFVDASAFNSEQGNRARKLFAAVVLAALDDAIADDKKYGNGPEQIARWARSRDGREVLSCAGIDPNERVVGGLMEFVAKGVRTSGKWCKGKSKKRFCQVRHASKESARCDLALETLRTCVGFLLIRLLQPVVGLRGGARILRETAQLMF